MTSAVDKLIATTELLERVLLYLDDPRELFRVKRVNHKFIATVEGSVALRQQLGVAHRSFSSAAEHLEPWIYIHPFLYPVNQLDYGPYRRYPPGPVYGTTKEKEHKPCEPYESSIDYCEISDLPETGYVFVFGLLLYEEPCKRPLNTSIGFTTDHDRRDCTFDKGSWRSARITLMARPVKIRVGVLVETHAYHRRPGHNEDVYWESKENADGVMTLGEMVDLLDEVRSRSEEEHLLRLGKENELLNAD